MKKDPFQYIFRFCCDPGFNDAEEIPALLRYVDEARIDDLDENLAKRARRAKSDHRLYVAIMCAATAVALVLLFVPALGGQWWFWLAWPLGGLISAAVKALRP